MGINPAAKNIIYLNFSHNNKLTYPASFLRRNDNRVSPYIMTIIIVSSDVQKIGSAGPVKATVDPFSQQARVTHSVTNTS